MLHDSLTSSGSRGWGSASDLGLDPPGKRLNKYAFQSDAYRPRQWPSRGEGGGCTSPRPHPLCHTPCPGACWDTPPPTFGQMATNGGRINFMSAFPTFWIIHYSCFLLDNIDKEDRIPDMNLSIWKENCCDLWTTSYTVFD